MGWSHALHSVARRQSPRLRAFRAVRHASKHAGCARYDDSQALSFLLERRRVGVSQKAVGDMRGPRSPSRVTEVLATADGRMLRRCHAAGRMAPGRRRASRAVRWLRNRCRRARRAFTTATAAPTRRFALHHPGLLQRPAARWRNRTDRTGSRHRRVGCRPVRRYPALAEAAGLPDQSTHNC